jgi:predicted DNA-binding transcriptional regulator YafY
MPRNDTPARLDRLDLPAARLKAEAPMTVAGLAAEFGIGPRTLSCDISVLRARGLPVEADRGRGGGIRPDRHRGVGRLALTCRGTVERLVVLAVAERKGMAWMKANLGPVRRKLEGPFAPATRERICGLRARMLIGKGASVQVPAAFRAPGSGRRSGAVFAGFPERRAQASACTDAEGRGTARTVETQVLLLNAPVCYLVGWDRGRDAPCTFRLDRIAGISVTDEPFALRPATAFAAVLEGCGARPA